MPGVIRLGTAGALRDYSIKQQGEGIAWSRGPANPFSAKVNTSNQYDEVDQWNEWVQEDWQQGVGQTDPEAGGFLYGELETRVPNQMLLPPLIRQVDTREVTGVIADCRYMPENMAGEITVGTGGHARVAMKFTTPNSIVGSPMQFWIYANINPSIQVACTVYTDSGGPDTNVGSGTSAFYREGTPGFYWHDCLYLGVGSLSPNTSYWLVVYPVNSQNSFKVGYGTSGYNTPAKSYNGSAWSDITGTYLMYSSQFHYVFAGQNRQGNGFFRFNGNLYCYSDARVWKYDPTDDQWDLVSALSASGPVTMYSVTGAVTWGDKVFFGSGGVTNNDSLTMSTSETFADAGVDANLYVKYGPYLYRALGNELYYSADGSNWEGPFQVGSDEFVITGMAGMGDSLFVGTAEALYRFAPGDVVEGITTWGSLNDTNGTNMVNFQGAIYATVNGRVVSFTQDGRLQDVWIKRDDDVIKDRIGKIGYLCVMNNWLIAHLSGDNLVGRTKSTLWAYQDGAWHHIATLPASQGAMSIANSSGLACYYDRATRCLWAITPRAITYRMYMPDYALNPFNDDNSYYMPRAWFQQDRYYGGLKLVDKAFDQVTIEGDNLSTNVNVKVYWQDQDSTAWEYLGTITKDSQGLRWPFATRPIGRWLKLGLLLQTNDGDETPRVRAVIVKNLPFPNDRIRDTMTLTLKDYIELPGGGKDTYTRAQQWAHIKSLIETKGTFVYQDPFGDQYEVAIIQYSATAPIYDYRGSSNKLDEMEVMLIVEQIPDGTYAP